MSDKGARTHGILVRRPIRGVEVPRGVSPPRQIVRGQATQRNEGTASARKGIRARSRSMGIEASLCSRNTRIRMRGRRRLPSTARLRGADQYRLMAEERSRSRRHRGPAILVRHRDPMPARYAKRLSSDVDHEEYQQSEGQQYVQHPARNYAQSTAPSYHAEHYQQQPYYAQR